MAKVSMCPTRKTYASTRAKRPCGAVAWCMARPGRRFRAPSSTSRSGGAPLQLYAPDLPDGELTLIDADRGTLHDLHVAWRNGDFLGVAFRGTVSLPDG